MRYTIFLSVIGFLGWGAPYLHDGQVNGQHVPSSVTAFLEVLACLVDRVWEAVFFGGSDGLGMQKAIG
jgi:hypothetical protein